MRKASIIICTIILCMSVISCTPKQVEEDTDIIGIDEFKNEMLRKYNLDKVEINENQEMTISYYFTSGPSETDMTAVKFESLVYYKPREDKFDSLKVEIYSQDEELVKIYTYNDEKWTEPTD